MSQRPSRPDSVIGPAGQPLTLDTLPPADTHRWVIRRKAEVVAAVRCGLISLEEACDRYRLSVEEYSSWQRMVETHGVPGLRTTRLKKYRLPDEEELVPALSRVWTRHDPFDG